MYLLLILAYPACQLYSGFGIHPFSKIPFSIYLRFCFMGTIDTYFIKQRIIFLYVGTLLNWERLLNNLHSVLL